MPSRRPIRGTPSEPVRADVRSVRHPVRGCKPSRLPLACGHHHCASCLSYPNVVRSSCTEKDCASPFFIPHCRMGALPGNICRAPAVEQGRKHAGGRPRRSRTHGARWMAPSRPRHDGSTHAAGDARSLARRTAGESTMNTHTPRHTRGPASCWCSPLASCMGSRGRRTPTRRRRRASSSSSTLPEPWWQRGASLAARRCGAGRLACCSAPGP